MNELLELFRTSDTVRLSEITDVIRSSEEYLVHKMEEFKSNICSTVTIMNTGLKELKSLLRDPCSDNLPNLQSRVNEVIEQSKAHYATLVREMNTALRDSESNLEVKIDTLQANLSSTLTLQLQRLQRGLEGLQRKKVSSESEGVAAATSVETANSWNSEKKRILRKLEAFANASLSTLELLRQESLSQGGRPWISIEYTPNQVMRSMQSGSFELTEFVITVRNAEKISMLRSGLFADWILWHGSDKCFHINFLRKRCVPDVVVEVYCNLLADPSCFSWDNVKLTALNKNSRNNITLSRSNYYGNTRQYYTLFSAQQRFLGPPEGFIENGELKFRLRVDFRRGFSPEHR